MAGDPAAACADTLFLLLDKEWQALLQLSYLVDNVHKPIFDATQAGPRCLTPAPPTNSPAAAAAAVFPCATSSSSSTVSSAFANATALLHTSLPQPITTPEPAGHVPLLSYTHYWALFANLPTLYESHAQLVRQLGHVLHHLRGHHRHKRRHTPPLAGEGKEDLCSSDGNELLSWTSSALSSPREPHHGLSGGEHDGTAASPSSLLSSPVSEPAVGDKSLAPVLRLFCGDAMRRYMAEHMMYTVQYTKSIAPRVLQLARLWRWSNGGTQGALGRLLPADQQLLRQHSGLLDFLRRSFGPGGRPRDGRVSQTTLPESSSANSTTSNAVRSAEITSSAHVHSPALGVGKPAGHAMVGVVQDTKASNHHGLAAHNNATHTNMSNNNNSSGAAGQLPADWAGFQTLLLLLATPLPSLRRCVHVARMLIESGLLSAQEQAVLQSDFVDVAAQNMAEVSNSVMEVLAQHDVGALLDLVDDTATLTARSNVAGGGHGLREKAGGQAAAAAAAAGVPPCIKTGAVVAANANAVASQPTSPTILQRLRSGDCTRQLVHYGRLQKRVRRGRHERLVFLFSDCLCHVEELSNGRFRLCGSATLDVVRVRSMGDAPAMDIMNCFEVILPGANNVLTFFADTPEQKRQWVDAIHYAVRHYMRQGTGGGNAVFITAMHHTATASLGGGGGGGGNARPDASSPSPPSPQSTTTTPANAAGAAGRMPPVSAASRLRRQGRYDAQLQQLLAQADRAGSHDAGTSHAELPSQSATAAEEEEKKPQTEAVAAADKGSIRHTNNNNNTNNASTTQHLASSAANSEHGSALARQRTMPPPMLSAQSLSRNSSFAAMRAFTTPRLGEGSTELVNILPTSSATGASTPMLHAVSLHASVHRRVGSMTLPLRAGPQANVSGASSAQRSPVQGEMTGLPGAHEERANEAGAAMTAQPPPVGEKHELPEAEALSDPERLFEPVMPSAVAPHTGKAEHRRNLSEETAAHEQLPPLPHEAAPTAAAEQQAASSTPHWRTASGSHSGLGQMLGLTINTSPGPGGSMQDVAYGAGAVARTNSNLSRRASYSTPLRRPVSERFESAQALKASAPRPQRTQSRSRPSSRPRGRQETSVAAAGNATRTTFPLLSQLSTPERAELALTRPTRSPTQSSNDENEEEGRSPSPSEAQERTSSADGSLMTVRSVFSSSEAGSALSLREEGPHEEDKESGEDNEQGTAAGQAAADTTQQPDVHAGEDNGKAEQDENDEDEDEEEDDGTVAAITGFHSSPTEVHMPTRPGPMAAETAATAQLPARHVDPTEGPVVHALHSLELQPSVFAEGEDEESSSAAGKDNNNDVDGGGSPATEHSKAVSPTTAKAAAAAAAAVVVGGGGKADTEEGGSNGMTVESSTALTAQPTD